jgi:hypothetical protein
MLRRTPEESWLDLEAAEEDKYFVNMVTGEPGEGKSDEDVLEPREEFMAWKARWEATIIRRGRPQCDSSEEELSFIIEFNVLICMRHGDKYFLCPAGLHTVLNRFIKICYKKKKQFSGRFRICCVV